MEEKLDFELNFTPEALKMMEDRMILKSDISGVIKSYKQTGEAIEDSESGLLIARERLGNVTFWAEFTEDEESGSVEIIRAYSHRMQIMRRIGS